MSLFAYFIIWIFVILNSKMTALKKNIFFVLLFLSGYNLLFAQAVIPKFGVKAARDWLAGHSVLYRALTTRLLNLNAFRVREQQKSGDTILSIAHMCSP